MKKNILFVFLVLLLPSFSCAMDIFSFKKEAIVVDGRKLNVLIADDTKKREQGLSQVKLQELKGRGIDGMLFVFDDESSKTFQSWYMNFDLILLGLEKIGKREYRVVERKLLNIGTTNTIKGRYVLELPIYNNSLLGK